MKHLDKYTVKHEHVGDVANAFLTHFFACCSINYYVLHDHNIEKSFGFVVIVPHCRLSSGSKFLDEKKN